MKGIIFVLVIIYLLIPACSSSPETDYKLTDEEFALLMLDLHIADILLPELEMKQKDSLKIIYWKRLSDVYQLSKEEIKQEIDKLETNPEKLKKIIDRVKIMADSIQ